MENEEARCWCGSTLKDKPHNCVGTRGRVEGLLSEIKDLNLQVERYKLAVRKVDDCCGCLKYDKLDRGTAGPKCEECGREQGLCICTENKVVE